MRLVVDDWPPAAVAYMKDELMGEGAVFAGMTREELNSQYDQRTLVPDTGPLFDMWRQESEATASRVGAPRRLAYGDREDQFIDFFAARQPAKGVHIHYHGGAWRALESRDVWWLAEPWLAAGFHFAAVNFGLVPRVTIAEQARDAALALKRLPGLVADATPVPGAELVVSGHSSGAHLAAMAALTGLDHDRPLSWEPDHVILASGLYDLEPVQLSSRNAYLQLDRDAALRLSPVQHVRHVDARVCILWSRNELEEFRRQSWSMAAALRERHVELVAVQCDASTHFDTWARIVPDLLR
jgi:arylformamidase